jgi:hypothetical protein
MRMSLPHLKSFARDLLLFMSQYCIRFMPRASPIAPIISPSEVFESEILCQGDTALACSAALYLYDYESD